MAASMIEFRRGMVFTGLSVKTEGLGVVKGAAMRDVYGDLCVNVMSPDFSKMTEEERCLAVDALKAAAMEANARHEARVKFNNAVKEADKKFDEAAASVQPVLP